jgi:hypothetical protein
MIFPKLLNSRAEENLNEKTDEGHSWKFKYIIKRHNGPHR